MGFIWVNVGLWYCPIQGEADMHTHEQEIEVKGGVWELGRNVKTNYYGAHKVFNASR
jgi:hypothetical protein